MSEPLKKTPALVPPKVGGGTPPSKNPLDVAAAAFAAKSNPPPAPVAVPPDSKPALFGGHKGTGKKRADGLVAGSPAAIAADKEKNAARMREARALKKSAEVPPPLARPVSSVPGASDAVAVAPADLSRPLAAVAGLAAPVAGFAPTFVPWLQSKLQKPAALLTKILARSRDFLRGKQIKKLNLTPEREKKVIEACRWRDDVVNDFSTALAECATIELNKHQVPGAEHSHYITLAMSAGELVYQEIETSRLIERLVLEDRAEKVKANAWKN